MRFSTLYIHYLIRSWLLLFTLYTEASTDAEKKSVLFVCLGNICRSPMAAAIFRHLLRVNGTLDQWIVDSAAHGYFHVGESMDARAIKTLRCHGIRHTNHTARLLTEEDYFKFQYMLALSEDDLQGLDFKAPENSTAHFELLGAYDPEGRASVHDPFYVGNSTTFENCFQQSYRSCTGFLEFLATVKEELSSTVSSATTS